MKKLFLAALFMPLMLSSAAFAQYSGPQTGLRDPVATGGCVWLGVPGCPLVTSGGGGGGGGGDASAANQIIIYNRLGDLIANPAQYSLADRLKTINTTLGSPFQDGGSIGNTAFGINGMLPAFASTPTVNLGTLNGAATAAGVATVNTTLGTPFQAGGSIGNTTFASTTADGADVAQGAVADAVYAGSGNATVNGILKGVYSRINTLLGYYRAEDAVHNSGDYGIMALALRSANSYSTATSSTAGDYDGLHTSPTGELFISRSDASPITVTSLTATGVLFTADTAGFDSVGFQTTGTWVGSLVFEASDDNTNFVNINLQNAAGATASSQTNSTNNSIYSYPAQHRYFRARASVYTSGTITATALLRTGPPPSYSSVTLATMPALVSGTATIGGTIQASTFADTSTVLTAGNTFTGSTRDLGATTTNIPWSYFGASVWADQPGTVWVYGSNNSSTWIPQNGTAGTAVAAGNTVDVKVPIRFRYWYVKYTNGATTQTNFNVNSSFTAN